MAILLTLQGPEVGHRYPLEGAITVLGRQADATICLSAKAVSRHHAQIVQAEGGYFLEDLDSSNGTFLNGTRLNPHVRVRLTEQDHLQIGPYLFGLRLSALTPPPTTTEPSLIIRDQVSVVGGLSGSVYGQDPAQKLQAVLEIAQHLARTLDLRQLLAKLLDQLMNLFPHADRALVLLCEEDRLEVRGQRLRDGQAAPGHLYSRTIVKKALDEGVGIRSDDIQGDERFQSVNTILTLDIHSLLCVPLLGQNGRPLGVLQLERFRRGQPFRMEDLQLLSTIGLQVAVVLENAALHEELLRKERQDQELALAREIQQGFLPTEFERFKDSGFELFARVLPAREVSGDLYDFFPLADGRLSFFVGDVSGKGIPAALFMVAVHTLCRHVGAAGDSPAATLIKLNDALAADNPQGQFVTLAHGIYTPTTGEVVLSSGGHPLPLLRRADGRVAPLNHRTGRMLGYPGGLATLTDARFTLTPGELMVFYTDGFTEAKEPTKESERRSMFGLPRLQQVVAGFDSKAPLEICAERAKTEIDQFTRSKELQDDLTLFLLRRTSG
ncbi:MAG TPA: SpoIIE family protein phosphatase [Gemmataceae bacterium]|nr:SpoIIE family protein phosphatase [Gemmataceae bacterium]